MPSKQIPLDWVKNLKDEQQRSDFEYLVRNSTQVLTRLKEILVEKEQGILSQDLAIQDYDSPSWGYKQAHRNGQRSALKQITDLIGFIN